MKTTYFSFFFILFSFSSSFSQHIENSFEKGNKMALSPKVSFYEDVSTEVSFEEISAVSFSSKFTLSENPRLNFGYTKSAYWLKIEVDNTLYQSEDWVLEVAFPNIDYLDFYYKKEDGSYQKIVTGDMYRFQQRPLFDNNFAFPIIIPQGLSKTFYIRGVSSGTVTFPISISNNIGYIKKSQNEAILYGLLYGSMLIMVLYNIFIYFSIRDRNYIVYIFSILGSFSFLCAKNGHVLQFFLQDAPQLTAYFLIISIGWSISGGALFAKEFLNTKSYHKTLNLTLTLFAFIGLIIAILALILEFSVILKIAAFFSFLTTFLLLSAGIIVWRKGSKTAVYFVLALGGYIAGVFAYILNSAGIIPNTVFTSFSMEVGVLLQITLLSLALGDKFRLMKIQRDKVQKKLLATQGVALSIQERANKELEGKVLRRTAEINEQKEELLATLSKVQEQNEEIEAQSNNLSKAYKSIQSSLSYAQRIQVAKLPERAKIMNAFQDSFILFQPKDVVSGDFYWFSEIENKTIIASVDCTGHGVPGAFMSMIGSELLHEIVNLRKITKPSAILSELHKGVRLTLRQEDTDNRDGMDIAICNIENHSSKKKTLTFAGAKNPLLMISENKNSKAELTQIKGDKLPIGGFQREKERLFTNHSFEIREPTTVYIFTDGYQDQFGGTEDRKFMIKRLRKMLLEIHNYPMQKQKEMLYNTMKDWMKGKEQIDDILIIGFQL